MPEPRPMKRAAGQSVEEMAAQLEANSAGNRLNRSSYPEVSAEIKTKMLAAVIGTTTEMMQNVSEHGRLNLDDLEAVKDTAARYMSACQRAGVVPGISGFSAACGYSRQYVHRYIDQGRTDSARFMDALRTAWSAILEQMTLTRACSEPTGIFLLKNSGCGMSDKADLSVSSNIVSPESETRTVEDIKKWLEDGAVPARFEGDDRDSSGD